MSCDRQRGGVRSVRVFELEERRTAARGPRISGGCPPWTSWRLSDGRARSCLSGEVVRWVEMVLIRRGRDIGGH